jgi:hypothetical protein
MLESSNRVLLILFIAVGSNVFGYALLIVTNPVIQLMLAGIVPALMIALVYKSLLPGRFAPFSKSSLYSDP